MFGCGKFSETDWLLFVDDNIQENKKIAMREHLNGCRSCAEDFLELKKSLKVMEVSEPVLKPAGEKVFRLVWENVWKVFEGFRLEPLPVFRDSPTRHPPKKAVIESEGVRVEFIPPEGTQNKVWKIVIYPEEEFSKLIVKFNGKFLRLVSPFSAPVEIEHFESGEYKIRADHRVFKIKATSGELMKN